MVQKRFKFPPETVELYAERVANRGLCAVAQAESLRYKLLGGLAVRRWAARPWAAKAGSAQLGQRPAAVDGPSLLWQQLAACRSGGRGCCAGPFAAARRAHASRHELPGAPS